MKPKNHPSRPRLVCRLVRWLHRDDAPASAWTSRHIANCAACQAYFQREATLDDELRTAAPREPADVPAGLEDRIWAAVQADQDSRSSTRREASPRRWGGWSLVPVGLAVAWALVLWLQPDDSPESAGELASVEFTENDMHELVASIGEVTADWWVQPPAGDAPPVRNPLSDEWNALEDDAASALRFLERSFFPIPRSAS